MDGSSLALHVHGDGSSTYKHAGVSAVLWRMTSCTIAGERADELWRCWRVAERLSSEEAEYNALLLGLECVLLLPHRRAQLIVNMEDQCVISQLQASYLPRSVAAWQLETQPRLRILLAEVLRLLEQLCAQGFVCVVRRIRPSENRSAAALAKRAVEMRRDGFVRQISEPPTKRRGRCISHFPGFAKHTMQLVDARPTHRKWHLCSVRFAVEHACHMLCCCGDESLLRGNV